VKVVILAGGYGTRFSEYTKTIPKPMVKVLGKSIIQRIIDYYISYGHNEFYIALGYKGEQLKKYFLKKKFSKKIKDLINMIVKYVGFGEPIFSKIKFRNDELTKLFPSISKANKILKWKPKINLETGLKKTIKFYKDNEKN